MHRALLVGLALFGGCVRSQSTQCGDYLCPDGFACVTYTPLAQQFCVPESDTRCTGMADGTLCDDGLGTCYGGGCFPVGCGNGRIDDVKYGPLEECDDMNRRSHDGCSSSCTVEIAHWDFVAPGAPGRNNEHAMTYDPAHAATTMFGGYTYGEVTPNTWVTHNGGWQRVSGGGYSPRARGNHAAAYDLRRERMVVFGGRPSPTAPPLDDTWEWDGERWTPGAPMHTPPPRWNHAMAYDAIHRMVVVYGGRGVSGSPLADAWGWNGSDWTQLASGPPALADHVMAFDPARGTTVVVGETASGVVTWLFDGDAWTAATGAQPPSAREAVLAYDPASRKLVLSAGGQPSLWDGTSWQSASSAMVPDGKFAMTATTTARGVALHGGTTQLDQVGSAVSSHWAWIGAAWSRETPRPPLPSRVDALTALDPDRGRIVLFGGVDIAGTTLDETWELAPEGWISVAAGVRPPPTRAGMIEYDRAHKQIVLLREYDTTMWIYTGGSWTSVATTLPQLADASLTYDPAVGLILYGGTLTSAGLSTNRMFIWNGTTWTEFLGPRPSARYRHAAGYDPVAKRVIMFGGQTRIPLGETWEWNSATMTWTELFPPGVPSARANHVIAWDAARARLVLAGGGTNDVWEWDRAAMSWRPIAASGAPAQVKPGMSSPDGHGIVVPAAGGFHRLRWSGVGPLEACTGSDGDHDGALACADPDCEEACRLVETTCGDGACNAFETCALCPGDCGACPVWCGDGVCAPGETADDCPGDCVLASM